MQAKATDVTTGLYPEPERAGSTVRLLKIPRAAPAIEEYGFRLTRSKWDPYPWVSEVIAGTPASLCGLKTGDCILKVNDIDIIGMRIDKIAQIVKEQKDGVTFKCWRSDCEIDCDESSICCVPMPTSLRRLVIIVDSILKVIECPVCTATISPPVMQCQNGHLLCLECRIRSAKCPICRGFFTPMRSSVAEQIYSIVSSTFQEFQSTGKLRHRIFGNLAKYDDSCSVTKHPRKPWLATNKILNKLLQSSKAESLENLFNCNSAKLLRAEHVMSVESGNEKRTELTSTSKPQGTGSGAAETGEQSKCSGSDSLEADSLLEQQDFERAQHGQTAEERGELFCQTTPTAVTAPSALKELWSEPPVKAKSKSLTALLLLH